MASINTQTGLCCNPHMKQLSHWGQHQASLCSFALQNVQSNNKRGYRQSTRMTKSCKKLLHLSCQISFARGGDVTKEAKFPQPFFPLVTHYICEWHCHNYRERRRCTGDACSYGNREGHTEDPKDQDYFLGLYFKFNLINNLYCFPKGFTKLSIG